MSRPSSITIRYPVAKVVMRGELAAAAPAEAGAANPP